MRPKQVSAYAVEPPAVRGLCPRTPVAGALMADRRTVMVAARVTPAEHAAWQAKAAAVGVSPSRRLRPAMARGPRRRPTSSASAPGRSRASATT